MRAQRPAGVPAAKLIFFVLISAFVILSPLSVSGDRSREGDDLVKWSRVIILVLLGLSGMKWLNFSKLNVSKRLLSLAAVFTLAAAWSTSPLWGFAFKGMFLASIIAGIMLSSALSSESDLRAFLRCLTLTSVLALALVGYQVFTQADPVMIKGRLWVGKINPNLLAQASTMFAILCTFHVLIRDRALWMLVAGLSAIPMLCITFLSGSRGAVLMLIAGGAVLLPALGRQQKQVVMLACLSVGGIALASYSWFSDTDNRDYLEASGEEEFGLRLTNELTKNTRGKIWSAATRITMRSSPAIGMGWHQRNNRTRNVQSAYLQIFVDSGFVGLVFLLAFLGGAIPLLLRSMKIGRRVQGIPRILCFSLSATAFALLLHGAFESSLVAGASPNAIVLAFSISQLDRLQGLAVPARRPAPAPRMAPRMRSRQEQPT